MNLAAKIVAAIGIVLVGAMAPASADPGGWNRGRGRSRGRSYRHWNRGRDDYNPLPGFLGGVFGGWLADQLTKDRDDPQERYRDDEPGDGLVSSN
jgi:hypothetical protein